MSCGCSIYSTETMYTEPPYYNYNAPNLLRFNNHCCYNNNPASWYSCNTNLNSNNIDGVSNMNIYRYVDSGRNFGRPKCERECFKQSSNKKDLYDCLNRCYN